jgi:hypothetical protein
MGLGEFLFGRLIKINDDKLGELTTKVKSDNPSINYTWTGEHKLKGQRKPTVFILEGNSFGPHGDQLKSVYRIIDTLDDITTQVDKELKGRINTKPRYKGRWTNEFYLAAIVPYNRNVRGLGNQFEIQFEPIEVDDTDYVGLIWNNDRLTEIEGK